MSDAARVPPDRIVLAERLKGIAEHWRPAVIARLNGQEVKLVKFRGEFVWHHHADVDEFFLCLDGAFRVEFRDRSVELRAGDCLVVPRGVEHRPVAGRLRPASPRSGGVRFPGPRPVRFRVPRPTSSSEERRASAADRTRDRRTAHRTESAVDDA